MDLLRNTNHRSATTRTLVGAAAAALALAVPALAHAGSAPASLLAQAQGNPSGAFAVVVQTNAAAGNPVDATVRAASAGQRAAFDSALQAANDAAAQQDPAAAVNAQLNLVTAQTNLVAEQVQAQSEMRWRFTAIPAVAATMTGAEIQSLAASGDVVAVTPDRPLALTEANPQKWPDAVGAKWFWSSTVRRASGAKAPTIAVVDSGIDATRVEDFGARVLGQVNLTSIGPNSPGDGRGHGTMVASIAAGAANKYAGADPDAKLISLDVINDNGEGRVSDLIAACDWILQNKQAYGIRVANFSVLAGGNSSFLFDPVNAAVEKLWLNGVVVVAAAGNTAVNGNASGVVYTPANDPFVITVGALDVNRTPDTKNDVAAPWSSWGYTNDGFLKPEISAPGRYIVGAIPASSTLAATGGQDPKLPSKGYMQLSGTSFSAPMVAGAAADVLAIHPDWTPDQVKGALMLTAAALPAATPGSAGVGELDIRAATNLSTSPPNPNLALESYVVATPAGPVFDVYKWMSAAYANASWSSASWSSASWSSASWSSASWSSASWSSASWSSASWTSNDWASQSASGGSDRIVNAASSDAGGDG